MMAGEERARVGPGRCNPILCIFLCFIRASGLVPSVLTSKRIVLYLKHSGLGMVGKRRVAKMSTDTWKEFEHNPVSHSVAHHVVAIANLREKQGYARVSDVAKVLNITRGSASLTLKSLKQKGLVLEDENRFLLLSDGGQSIADSVRGKRLVMRKFFSDVLGVPAGQAEVDTCKVEHLISEDAAHRLAMFLRFLQSDDPKVRAFRAAWRDSDLACSDEAGTNPARDPDGRDWTPEERE